MAGYTLQVSVPPHMNKQQTKPLPNELICMFPKSQPNWADCILFSHGCWILMNPYALQSRVWTRDAHTQTPSVTWHVPHTGCYAIGSLGTVLWWKTWGNTSIRVQCRPSSTVTQHTANYSLRPNVPTVHSLRTALSTLNNIRFPYPTCTLWYCRYEFLTRWVIFVILWWRRARWKWLIIAIIPFREVWEREGETETEKEREREGVLAGGN